jgi:DNA-binding response OmpR family regulator
MQHAKKLLIIEDDPIIANVYRSRFEKEGYQVEVAADGQAGFYRIHELTPDVVLLDLMLPQINGVDILKKIRAQKRFEALPVIVFTNAYFRDLLQDAIKAGATKVFHKATLTPRQLVEAVEEVLYGDLNASAMPNAPTAPAPTAPTPAPTLAPRSTSPPPEAEPLVPAPTATAGSAAATQSDLRLDFAATAPERLAALRKLLNDFTRAHEDGARLAALTELYRKVHALTGSAGLVGLKLISQVSASLEALLRELSDKPTAITASTIRTIANGVDFLGRLLEGPGLQPTEDGLPPRILVVDDEVISRRAVLLALEKANLRAVAVEDPNLAYALTTTNQFDLVILDVDMPGMNGFELCKKLRSQVEHKDTPVIFVTGLNDFETRAQSTLSGGNDLIAKPFLFSELAVKALSYVLKPKLQTARKAAAPS